MNAQYIKDHLPSSPAFVIDKSAIEQTLLCLKRLRQQSGCKVLYSIKALPFSTVLQTVQLAVDGFSVSSLFEARLANEIAAPGQTLHLTTPGLRPDEFDEISALCSHISFNSLSQFQRFSESATHPFSTGLRVNPKCSLLNDERYDPCRMHSKLGVDIDALITSEMFAQIQGLHWHNMFSATDFAPLTQTVKQLRRKLGGKLASLNWLNLGGGYLYGQIKDHQSFIDLVAQLISDFDIEVFIEPGKALVGHAGFLVATIIDCFRSDGKIIAVLDTSINHHPELFEFQRTAELHEHTPGASYPVILAGCTCLAGDLFGEYRLTAPVKVGDKVLFKQVGAYSLIKAHRFNGYNLPDIYCYQADLLTRLKHYDYQNYRQQWLAD